MQTIYLASPLVFDHAAGQKVGTQTTSSSTHELKACADSACLYGVTCCLQVETPMSIPADPADGFRALNDS